MVDGGSAGENAPVCLPCRSGPPLCAAIRIGMVLVQFTGGQREEIRSGRGNGNVGQAFVRGIKQERRRSNDAKLLSSIEWT